MNTDWRNGEALAAARLGAYRLLARLALSELDEPLAEAVAALPQLGEALAASGGREALGALRSEYTHTFLMNAHPYESVYLDETAMLNTAQSAAVLEHYREHGYDPPAAASTGAPDHLGLELGFMAHLIEREERARRAGNPAVATALRDEQLHFLGEHLLRWAPLFGAVLAEVARSPFYQSLGDAIASLVLGDYEHLSAAGLRQARTAESVQASVDPLPTGNV